MTTNRGARLREGANINKSLLALGNCINALAENRVCVYVRTYIYTYVCVYRVQSLYNDTSIKGTLSSVQNAIFVYLTTSEMRTPH